MACNIIYNQRGEVEQVLTDLGTPSKLYQEAKSRFGEKEALDIFYVSQSKSFKDTLPMSKPFFKETPKYILGAENSANYANLTEDGEGNYVFYHIGRKGYETVKRSSGSTSATSRTEAAALSKVGGVAMYYPNANDSETMVSGDATYMVKVPMDKVYDFNSDPLNLREQAKARHEQEHPGKGYDVNSQVAYVTKIADELGYKMVVSEWDGRTRAQTLEEFKPVDVQETDLNRITKFFDNNYQSNKEKGYIGVVPKSKDEMFQQIYKEIYKERNSQGKYDALYRLSENYTKLSQQEITDLIMTSDLSSEIKDKYSNALNTPIGSRKSVLNLADKYTNLINKVKEEQPSEYWSVDIPSKEVIESSAKEGRIVDVQGGMGIVTEEGNMIGLFKYDNSQKGTAAAVQAAKIQLGGIKLDNFDGYLTKTYERNGFRVVSRVPFNEDYTPDNWSKEKHGTPDVVFMIYDPNNSLNIKESYFKTYEEAAAYRDSYVNQARAALVNPNSKEPTLSQVLTFISSGNQSKEPMNEKQKKDYKNALISNSNFSYAKLREAFYDKDGIFFVSSSKLISSGLYSQYEANNLEKDVELQEVVKSSIEALKNTEEDIFVEEEFPQVEKSTEITSFGKLTNKNPYVVQKDIQESLAGTTREEFDEAFAEIPYPTFKKTSDKESVFEEMQSFKKAEVLIDVSGTLKTSTKSNTEVVIPQVSEDITNTKTIEDIKFILSSDIKMLKALEAKTRILLEGIEKRLISQGYDVVGLSKKTPSENMMSYFRALLELNENTSQAAIEAYSREYDSYFEKDTTPEKGLVKSLQEDRNFVKLNTELTEEEVYNQQGLIKQEEGLYIKVNKKSTEELYPIVLSYPERIPSDVKTEEQLRRYVQSQSKNAEVKDADTAEIINLFKLYYQIPLELETKKENTEAFNQAQAQFTGDVEYLTKDFVSDFYKKILKEKAAESKEYKEFYSNFKVTEKGLELENSDPITLENMKPYISEDLKNYSLLSKSMPNLVADEAEILDSKNRRRDLVKSYPSTVEKFEGSISIIDNNTLIAKNTNKEFIKLKNQVFENIETRGNLTLYVKLDTPKSNYLYLNSEAPDSSHFLKDYYHLDSQPDKFIAAKNYLSKEEKADLYNDKLSCL